MKIHFNYSDCPCSSIKKIGLEHAINNYLAKKLYEHKEMTFNDVLSHFTLKKSDIIKNKYEHLYKGNPWVDKDWLKEIVKRYRNSFFINENAPKKKIFLYYE